ncbi:MAG: SDR family oxidoreductase [Kiritimatiellae bacterium]|nr:SDR family oxidoreductase [Kiritimatiellia bacterium]MDW8459432.1 SDR family oxidoreductase [Verrucomicrobiota bacterium]
MKASPPPTVLVTGGAVRIGRSICRAFASAGYRVVVHYNASSDAARACCRELENLGTKAWRVRANLASETGCRKLINRAFELAGTIHVLVNNAAVFNACPLSAVDAAALRREFAVNLFAPILLTRFFAERCSRGCVVNLLDRRIAAMDPARIPYVLTKKGLAEFTRSAALALAPRIRVNAVAPGPVLPPPGQGEDYLRARAGKIPTAAPISPDEVGRAVLYLAESPSITGQVLFVDGGQHLLGEGV